MEQGANCPAAGGPLCVAPITRHASHSYRRRTRRTASEGLAAAGGRLLEKTCLRRLAAQAHAERDWKPERRSVERPQLEDKEVEILFVSS
jgi:hypothetical protein